MASGDVGKWKLQEEAGMWVNQNTGEAKPAPLRYMEPGSVYYSPAQVERNREYGEMMRKRLEQAQNDQLIRLARTEQERILGPFIYTKSDENSFDDISHDTLARSAYLASFLKFGTDELWKTAKAKLALSDLPGIMNLSRPTVSRFWRDVRGKYFFRDNGGFLHAIGGYFVNGWLKSTPDIEYQKLYKVALRELYRKIPVTQHKRLGHVLKMLPFVNFEYNILCQNPSETEKDNIIPMTVADFCDRIGFDKAHLDKLVREYGRFRFTVDGHEEIFCKFLFDGTEMNRAHVYINPRLIYKGTDFRKVQAIAISFAASSRTT